MTHGPAVTIPEHELVFRATRSGGPGGQHVNTSSTRVELWWNVVTTTGLDPAQRVRVLAKLATRIDSDGWLRVVASDSRSQHQNRVAARERLVRMVERAAVPPNVRKRTRIPRVEREKRLTSKRRRGAMKQNRRRPISDD